MLSVYASMEIVRSILEDREREITAAERARALRSCAPRRMDAVRSLVRGTAAAPTCSSTASDLCCAAA